MSDALQTILADPELRNWPQRGTAPIPTDPGAKWATPPFIPPRSEEPDGLTAAAYDRAPEIAAAPIISFPAPGYRGASAPDTFLLNTTAAPSAAETAPEAHDPYDPPRANSATDATEGAADNVDGTAPNSSIAPLSFDEITRRRRPITDKFGDSAEWIKTNWRTPKVLGAAAAALVATVTLAAWPSSAGDAAGQPTATLTAPATGAPAGAAAPAPVDGPIPVRSAEARCPAPSSDPMNAVRPDASQPWICVRAWGIDGQVLTLTLDGPSVISAVKIMPGVNSEADGQDQWLRYRTVNRVAWTFNDADRTKITQSTDSRRELLTQSVVPTGCAGGSPCRLVASQVVLTIEKTTPPAAAPTGSALGAVTETPADDSSSSFGVSRIEIIGHPAG